MSSSLLPAGDFCGLEEFAGSRSVVLVDSGSRLGPRIKINFRWYGIADRPAGRSVKSSDLGIAISLWIGLDDRISPETASLRHFD